MNKSSHDVTTVLAGGIGNQLFQLSSALFYSRGGNVLLEQSLGNPRRSKTGNPDICDFSLPLQVKLQTKRQTKWLEVKFHNLLLRISSGLSDNTFGLNLKIIIFLITRRLMSYFFWRGSDLYVPNGVGFSQVKVSSSKNQLFLGYFQTFHFISDPLLENFRKNFKLLYQSSWVETMIIQAKIDRPLIVHIRLSDYSKEKSFNTPSKIYFESAIKQLWELRIYKKVWIFSDEPKKVMGFLPSWVLDDAILIDNASASTAEIFEVMRHGHGYVISNSTFSWWSAFLSYTDNAKVIAPNPWFQGLSEPKDLIPDNWIRVTNT